MWVRLTASGGCCARADLSNEVAKAYVHANSQEGIDMDVNPEPPRKRGPVTLAIDVGGARLKAGLLDQNGVLVGGPTRVNTPAHPAPQAVLDAFVGLAEPLGHFDRISIGFPGVVRRGHVLTAPNLGTTDWRQFPLASSLT